MNVDERHQKIGKLTDKQAISILRKLTDRLLDRIPNNNLENIDQAQAITTLYSENGYQIDKSVVEKYLSQANESSVGQASRQLLELMAEQNDTDLLDRLDKELLEPPEDEVAGIELLISLPLIITGCVALLNVVSGIKYSDGKLSYDPVAAKDVIKTNLSGVTSALKSLIPFHKGK